MTLLLFVAAVVASALFAGLETGLYTTSRLRLFLDARADVAPAKRARQLLSDMPGLLAVLLLANNLANQAATLLAQVLLADWAVPSREVLGSLGVTVILFLLAESVPKNAYRRRRERLLYPTMPVLLVARIVLAPVALPVAAVARLLQRALRRRTGGAPIPRPVGHAMLDTGAEEGFLTSFQERVAHGVLAMRGRALSEEARAIDIHPVARLGHAGVTLPKGCRESRVLVLDPGGARCEGWVPLATLWTAAGFRAPARSELRPVTHVQAGMGLDAVYLSLDRTGSPFAVLRRPDGLAVLDADHLRQRVMGRFGLDAEGAPPTKG